MAEVISRKPPLGIRPQYIVDGQRFDEIIGGISRFNSVGKEIPINWLIELQEIYSRAERRRDKSENVSGNLITKNYDY